MVQRLSFAIQKETILHPCEETSVRESHTDLQKVSRQNRSVNRRGHNRPAAQQEVSPPPSNWPVNRANAVKCVPSAVAGGRPLVHCNHQLSFECV